MHCRCVDSLSCASKLVLEGARHSSSQLEKFVSAFTIAWSDKGTIRFTTVPCSAIHPTTCAAPPWQTYVTVVRSYKNGICEYIRILTSRAQRKKVKLFCYNGGFGSYSRLSVYDLVLTRTPSLNLKVI